ncbi:hypothetical protein COHA_004308 [Chlorella ohadii]|uniref:Protein DA1-like domain-containing protein n=1 Tax=Chlorella ohadii TaxID=2649997 RepID=A0AAD5DU38_9CHLO|nr:hypothetical protein COHA_004308 [Chlorella ohadii]
MGSFVSSLAGREPQLDQEAQERQRQRQRREAERAAERHAQVERQRREDARAVERQAQLERQRQKAEGAAERQEIQARQRREEERQEILARRRREAERQARLQQERRQEQERRAQRDLKRQLESYKADQKQKKKLKTGGAAGQAQPPQGPALPRPAFRGLRLESGRYACRDCAATAVLDTEAAQPVYTNVVRFFKQMRVALPKQPPLYAVSAGTMRHEAAKEDSGGRLSGPVSHVNGLCLSTETHTVQIITRQERTRSGSSFVTVRRERAGPVHCSVTGMLVMAGMPALLAGAIIAHECMHAYLRLTGVRSRQLTMHDEEGLCELMAVLYLKHEQSKGFISSHEGRLCTYLLHSIKNNPDPVYGSGYREAARSYQSYRRLDTLVNFVRSKRRLP